MLKLLAIFVLSHYVLYGVLAVALVKDVLNVGRCDSNRTKDYNDWGYYLS